MRSRRDVGFLFVGRGSDAQRLRGDAKARGLDNVVFHVEIEPAEIPSLYAQCHVGIVALAKKFYLNLNELPQFWSVLGSEC